MGRFDSFFTDDESELPENAPIEVSTTMDDVQSVTGAPDKAAAAFTLLGEAGEPESEQSAPEGDTASTDVDPTRAALPAQIADRPQTVMRARFSGHALFNDLVRRDWQRAIAADPLAYDGLLYVPTDASAAETDPDAGSDEEPAFTEINANQKTLSYSDPVLVAILDCPDERSEFSAADSDGETDGGVDDVMILRVAPPLAVLDAASDDDEHPVSRAFVPVGSILEWNEALADGSESRSWWYVHRIFTYGTASVGSLYYCIPARNFDTVMGDGND